MTVKITHSTPSDNTFSATGASAWDADHSLTGLGTMAEQNANNVAITGGSISGVSGIGTVTAVSGTAPVVSSGGNTPAISMAKATTSVDGYLSATDWNTFNNKQPSGAYLTAVTADSPLSGSGTSGSHLIIAQANTTTSGYLTNTDWNTFNNKQPAGAYLTTVTADAPLSGSGTSGSHLSIPASTGSVNGYLTSTDWTTFNSKANAGANSNITSMTGLTGGIATPDFVTFDTTITPTVAVGKLQWDPDYGTLQVGLDGGNVNLQIGQESNIYARNAQNATISDGQVVYISGSNGQKINVKLAKADSDTTSKATIGIVTEQILNTKQGFVTTFGLVHDLNTNAFNEGDTLYLSATTAGALTNIRPSAPNNVVRVGYVIVKSSSVGEIFVSPQVGFELNELDNVQLTTPAAGNILQYNGTVWYNSTAIGSGVF